MITQITIRLCSCKVKLIKRYPLDDFNGALDNTTIKSLYEKVETDSKLKDFE